jgi:hypothetical protein
MIIKFRLEPNGNDETTLRLTARVEESGKKLTKIVPVGIPDRKLFGLLGELVELVAATHGVDAISGGVTRVEGPDLVVEVTEVKR